MNLNELKYFLTEELYWLEKKSDPMTSKVLLCHFTSENDYLYKNHKGLSVFESLLSALNQNVSLKLEPENIEIQFNNTSISPINDHDSILNFGDNKFLPDHQHCLLLPRIEDMEKNIALKKQAWKQLLNFFNS